MGREIRMVPKDWQHPKDRNGYVPLHDKSYEEAADEWIREFNQFMADPDEQKRARESDCHYFWDWHGRPPDKESYRPFFGDSATHFQMYENVSEGTPVSPVFETEDQLVNWLVNQGHSEKAAREFVKHKYAPSMVMSSKGIRMGVDTYGDEAQSK